MKFDSLKKFTQAFQEIEVTGISEGEHVVKVPNTIFSYTTTSSISKIVRKFFNWESSWN